MARQFETIGGPLAAVTPLAVNGLVGIVAGGIVLALVSLGGGILGWLRKPAASA